ncbi:MAG: hypothetical protein ACI4YB_01800 [Oscillospiraceae bacterium]
MTERERLIELIKNGFFTKPVYEALCTNKRKASEYLADFLLENGVIVPPVKVGGTVYINGKPAEVSFIHIEHDMTFCIQVDCFWRDCEDCCFADSDTCNNGYFAFTADDIGKSVFLTRETAKKALAERGEPT